MLTPSWSPAPRQLRQFAALTPLAFAVLGSLLWRSTGSTVIASIVWGIGGLVAIVGIPFPNAIRPFYVLLMAVTLPIGWLISNLLLRFIFYGIFTPLGLFFRVLRRDALVLRRPEGEPFWRPFRSARDVASYYRQS